MVKYVLQHWHFYQPRRNDKWAKKINEECYKPNSKNGILNHISYNIGPTLIGWFVKNDKGTLERIIEADKGQALAQPYNHRIMPLIRHDEDLKTQIVWGKKYFKTFFKREPEGMWLPETATSKRVCRELARQGIKYTMGAPWQKKWNQDTNKPYKVDLGNNLEIIYFFYNYLSGRIAFNNQTSTGIKFLDNVDATLEELGNCTKDKEMVLLAYDGETFGHHHKLADLWAGYFPTGVKKKKNMELITISEYIKKFGVKEAADIWDYSSWSCHCGGLKRWTTGCDCAGGYKTYQEPLLKALERMEDEVHSIYVNEAGHCFKDVWDARNDFIELKLGNLKEGDFFKKHLKKSISKDKKQFLKEVLRAEYHTQLSFTSCGWFSANLSFQSEQNIMDAYSAAQLIKKAVGKDLVTGLLFDLGFVEDYISKGNKEIRVTGKEILNRHVNLNF